MRLVIVDRGDTTTAYAGAKTLSYGAGHGPFLDLELDDVQESANAIRGTGRAVVAIGGELHVELPVDVEVTLDAGGNVTAVHGAPDAEAIAEATLFAKQQLS